MTNLIEAKPRLVLIAPTTISFVCFRFKPGALREAELRAINNEIMLQL